MVHSSRRLIGTLIALIVSSRRDNVGSCSQGQARDGEPADHGPQAHGQAQRVLADLADEQRRAADDLHHGTDPFKGPGRRLAANQPRPGIDRCPRQLSDDVGAGNGDDLGSVARPQRNRAGGRMDQAVVVMREVMQRPPSLPTVAG